MLRVSQKSMKHSVHAQGPLFIAPHQMNAKGKVREWSKTETRHGPRFWTLGQSLGVKGVKDF